MRRIVLAAALAATGVLGSCGVAGERPQGYEKRDFKVDPGIRFRPTSLREIIANPQQGAEVKFDAILNRRDESIWQAYYTPFRPGEFKSFSVWPVDAAVWDPRGRGRSIGTLYVAADSPEIAELYALQRYTPIRISGVVQSTFDSRPWIQVHYVEEIDTPWFSEESLGNLIRGLDAAHAGTAHAMTLLDDALDGPLSPTGRSAAWKAKGHIYLAQKNFNEAESSYQRAEEAVPHDPGAIDGLRRAKRKQAPGDWSEDESEKEEKGTVNWKAMYTELHAEHGTTCKALAEAHARCGELAMTLTSERDAAVKAHAECGAGAEGMKKQLEERDAAIKANGEKLTAVEAERDAAVKAHADCGTGAEGMKKQLEEKDAALKTATEKSTALEAERDELKKKVEGGGADAQASKKQLEEKDAALKTANEKVAALETERDELKKRAEAGGDPDALKKQIEAKDAEVKAAQSKVTELEQNMKDREETIKKQREEIDRLNEELKKKGD